MTTNDRVPFAELRGGQLFQIGRELYLVSQRYDQYLTAQWVYPLQSRTRVVSISRDGYERYARVPTQNMVARYEQAWGFDKGSTLV